MSKNSKKARVSALLEFLDTQNRYNWKRLGDGCMSKREHFFYQSSPESDSSSARDFRDHPSLPQNK
jgi:hypothetical protein